MKLTPFLSLILSVMLVWASPVLAGVPYGQTQQISSAGIPAWAQRNVFPSISATPARAFGYAIMVLFNSISISGAGFFTSTPIGSGTGTNTPGSDGNWVNYASAASSGSNAGLNVATANAPYFQQQPRFAATIKTGANAGDILNCRIFVGLVQSGPTTDSPNIRIAAFRYATGTDGTAFWRCFTGNNGGVETTVTTTTAIASNTEYVMGVDYSNPSVAYFYINGAQVAAITTNLPTGAFAAYGYAVNQTTSASAVNFKVKNMWMDIL